MIYQDRETHNPDMFVYRHIIFKKNEKGLIMNRHKFTESQSNIFPLDLPKAHLGHHLAQALVQRVPALLEKSALEPQVQVGHNNLFPAEWRAPLSSWRLPE